jgi:hypothetical protein
MSEKKTELTEPERASIQHLLDRGFRLDFERGGVVDPEGYFISLADLEKAVEILRTGKEDLTMLGRHVVQTKPLTDRQRDQNADRKASSDLLERMTRKESATES